MLDILLKIVTLIATILTTFYIRKQTILSKKNKDISILNNPSIWQSNEKIKIKICNSSDYPVIIETISLINQLNRKTGELHEYIIKIFERNKYIKPTELDEIEIDMSKYPKNIPLSLEIGYKSAIDGFSNHRLLKGKDTRTII